MKLIKVKKKNKNHFFQFFVNKKNYYFWLLVSVLQGRKSPPPRILAAILHSVTFLCCDFSKFFVRLNIIENFLLPIWKLFPTYKIFSDTKFSYNFFWLKIFSKNKFFSLFFGIRKFSPAPILLYFHTIFQPKNCFPIHKIFSNINIFSGINSAILINFLTLKVFSAT